MQGRRKQLLIGPAKGMAVKEKYAKHTQHAKHANARGAGGMPPRKFLKKTCFEIASESFLSQNLLLHLENQVLWQDLKTTFFFPNDRFGKQ